jgi:hypothetical protein
MAGCHDMKKNELWTCPDCGLELRVEKECDQAGMPADQCKHETPCLVCCDKPLVRKAS